MSRILVDNSHERLQSNDCLMKYRYEYQYVTNYDIDEFILPRKVTNKNKNKIECKANQTRLVGHEKNTDYSIYEFAKDLGREYGEDQVNQFLLTYIG